MPNPRNNASDTLLLLLGCILLSGVWGMLAVYAAQSAVPEFRTYALRQLVWLPVAVAAGLAAWRIPFDFYWRHWRILTVGAAVFLALVLVAGVRVNGMRGWYDCGLVYLQPSELAKPFFLLALVAILREDEGMRGFVRSLAVLAVFGGLIAWQPDFGTLAIYAGSSLVVLFLAGADWKKLTGLAAALLAAAGVVVWRFPYVGRRFLAFLYWEDDLGGGGWHWFQNQLAMARGGWTGTGLGNSWWSGFYVPLANNDSVLAAITETLGVFGAWAVIGLWGVLLLLVFRLGKQTPERERSLFIWSAGGCLGVQVLLHLWVNTGLLPITGVPLPFYSYGGSSLVATLVLLGMVLSAGKSGSTDKIQ